MFGMSFTEALIIVALALILLGPEKMADVARALGKGVREFNKVKDQLQNQFSQELYRLDQPGHMMKPAEQPQGPIAIAAEEEAKKRLGAEAIQLEAKKE